MKFIETKHDIWHTVQGDDGPMVTITPAPHQLLTWLQWMSVRHHWPAGMPVGVIIGNDLDDAMVTTVFGPSRYWKRISVEAVQNERGNTCFDEDGEPMMVAERLGSELVTLMSSSFIEYLKRG